MITRDRLAETVAFQDLVGMVRYAFHLYAFEEARRQYDTKVRNQDAPPVATQVEQMGELLAQAKPLIPERAYKKLDEGWRRTEQALSAEQERVLGQVTLLGPLATAGIATLALQHELRKQFSYIDGVLEQLRAISTTDVALAQSLDKLQTDLAAWLGRARGMNDVFSYLLDAENVKERARFKAKEVVEQIVRQTSPLARGVRIDTSGVGDGILLPKGSLAEWGAILQNILINAYNAMLEKEERVLSVSIRRKPGECELLIQDTGVGVKVARSERLFEPFERGSSITPERMALGYGGSGLGLTIVRLLANKMGCEAHFVTPDEGFATAFSVRWKE
jgi:signal transduction histidine kinase